MKRDDAMRVFQVAIVCVAVLVTMAGQVKAGIIYSQGYLPSDIPKGAVRSSTGITAFDDFSISDVIITEISWRGIYVNHPPVPTIDDFSIRIFEDNAGALGVLIFTLEPGNAVSRIASTFSEYYEYSVSLNAPVWLSEGSYWLSIYNRYPATSPIPPNTGTVKWYWATNIDFYDNSYVGSGKEAAAFSTLIPYPLQYSISGSNVPTVPEPTSFAIWSVGLVGMTLLVPRRRRGL